MQVLVRVTVLDDEGGLLIGAEESEVVVAAKDPVSVWQRARVILSSSVGRVHDRVETQLDAVMEELKGA